MALAIGQEILDATVGVDLHGTKVGVAINQASLLSELLSKSITQVVRGVGRDEENGFADFGELDGEGARGGGFTHTSFASDEDPAESILIQNRLERGLHIKIIIVNNGRGHFVGERRNVEEGGGVDVKK